MTDYEKRKKHLDDAWQVSLSRGMCIFMLGCTAICLGWIVVAVFDIHEMRLAMPIGLGVWIGTCFVALLAGLWRLEWRQTEIDRERLESESE